MIKPKEARKVTKYLIVDSISDLNVGESVFFKKSLLDGDPNRIRSAASTAAKKEKRAYTVNGVGDSIIVTRKA